MRPEAANLRLGRTAVTGLLAVLPLALLWPALRHTIEARMLLHMLEFAALFASGWALQRSSLHHPRGRWLADGLALLDWRGWCGAALASIVAAAWMLPILLDLALLVPALAAAKYLSWWIAGWLLASSLRRMDPEVLLFFVGNLAWMMCSAGMLYVDAPARLCVNYLQDDQRQTGLALILLATLLGALALRQVMRPAPTPAAERAAIAGKT